MGYLEKNVQQLQRLLRQPLGLKLVGLVGPKHHEKKLAKDHDEVAMRSAVVKNYGQIHDISFA